MTVIYEVATLLNKDVNSKVGDSKITYKDFNEFLLSDKNSLEIISVIEGYLARSLEMAKNYIFLLALGAENMICGGAK